MAFLSTTNAPGTRAYTSVVCENNWFEERARIESGERVYIGCMEGAYLRPEDPDLSIAPDYRNPEVPADGRLVMPHRSWRSRTTFDSSRQGADDGFRIYSSLSGDDYCPIEKRGNSQLDDLRKTRSATTAPMATTARIANREKNAMFEQSRICDDGRWLCARVATASIAIAGSASSRHAEAALVSIRPPWPSPAPRPQPRPSRTLFPRASHTL